MTMHKPAQDTAATTQPWDVDTLRDPHGQPDKANRVQAMFDAIAPTYERVNTIASLGQDAGWRRRTVSAAGLRGGETVLDICCGTGDMLRTFGQHEPAPGRLIGLDFAANMLALVEREPPTVPYTLLRGDALALPLASASVDVVSCAFGVRNFAHLQGGLNEMARVLRPGGRVVILEFTTPRFALLRWAHTTYCNVVLPRVAAWISGDRTGAYQYLPRSIQTFETTRSMVQRLRDAGFVDVTARTMNLGGVALYRGVRAG